MNVRTFLSTPAGVLAPAEPQQCEQCNLPITGSGESGHLIDDKPVHDDCYFDALGEIIESHPPRGRR